MYQCHLKNTLFIAFSLLLATSSWAQVSVQPFRKGVKTPPKIVFNARTAKGKELNVDSMEGKTILFHTWETRKDVIKKEDSRTLQRVYKFYSRAGLQMYNISMDKDKRQAERNARAAGYAWPTICDGHGPERVPGAQKGTIIPSMGFFFTGKSLPRAFVFKDNVCVWSGQIDALEEAMKTLYPDIPTEPESKSDKNDNMEKDNFENAGNVEAAINAIEEAARLINLDKDFAGALKEIATISDNIIKHPKVIKAALPVIISLKPVGEDKTSVVLALRENEKAKNKLKAMTESAMALLATPLDPDGKRVGNSNTPSAKPNQKSPLEKLAQRQLDAAKKLIKANDRIKAYGMLQTIIKRYSATEAGREAQELIKPFNADQQFVADYKKFQLEKEADGKLRLALSYLKTNKTKLAKDALNDIIDDYPGTAAAKQAEAELEKI